MFIISDGCISANRTQGIHCQTTGKELSYPKYKAGHHVVKAVKENCTYDYVDELMAELLRMKEEYKSDANARAASGNILFSPPPVFICKQNPEVRGCAEPSFAI
ncbi:hypothetical protein DPMN_126931 [Dreissena polymorpha]|uniref:Uncharacterized protein n=2 Tax=Dreissena polymorpha TaxID=45954 RepID=A0A9D4JYD7_DREPO|nr:hypothetical protein DPMN_126931 [Dreissena polymorpha]